MVDSESFVVRARWILTATGQAIESGTITIQNQRIAAVSPAGERTPDVDYGNAVIIPGLVNTHTHLDLTTNHPQSIPGQSFVDWLSQVIQSRRQTPVSEVQNQIRNGLAQAQALGTTLIGDISAAGQSWEILEQADCWSVCFYEALGLPGSRVDATWRQIVNWMDSRPGSDRCTPAISPHAPYSVNRHLIEASSRLFPGCIHLAESLEEKELLDNRNGPFKQFLNNLNVWDESGLSPSWDWIVWRMSNSPWAILAHGNYLKPKHLADNLSISFCPRTHRYFGHPRFPLGEWLSQGTRVALGTDSLLSNPDLDVLSEACWIAKEYPEIATETILKMATLNGARALGQGANTGSIEVGKSADLVVVSVANQNTDNPYDLLLRCDLPNLPRTTFFRGRLRSSTI